MRSGASSGSASPARTSTPSVCVRRSRSAGRKAERERQRKEEWVKRTAEKRAGRVEELLAPEAQERQRRRKETELLSHPMWKRNSRILGISADNIPYYLNQELDGEYLFTCHRVIWQSTLFVSWVHGKADPERSRDIHIDYAVENLRKHYPDLLVDDLYWAFRDRKDVTSVGDVVGRYFAFLAKWGFAERYDHVGYIGNPFSWVFRCVMPKVVALPPEYNSPRYRPRPDGVLDIETHRFIELPEKG